MAVAVIDGQWMTLSLSVAVHSEIAGTLSPATAARLRSPHHSSSLLCLPLVLHTALYTHTRLICASFSPFQACRSFPIFPLSFFLPHSPYFAHQLRTLLLCSPHDVSAPNPQLLRHVFFFFLCIVPNAASAATHQHTRPFCLPLSSLHSTVCLELIHGLPCLEHCLPACLVFLQPIFTSLSGTMLAAHQPSRLTLKLHSHPTNPW